MYDVFLIHDRALRARTYRKANGQWHGCCGARRQQTIDADGAHYGEVSTEYAHPQHKRIVPGWYLENRHLAYRELVHDQDDGG